MRRKLFGNRNRGRDGGRALDEALGQWRESPLPKESLSEATRARILDGVRRQEERTWVEPLAALFLPAPRFALAAGLPALALTLLLGYSLIPSQLGGGVDPAPTRLQATKQGNEVVFLIANGQQTHTVSVSDKAHVVQSPETFTVTDSFRDRLQSDSDLVFYRFD